MLTNIQCYYTFLKKCIFLNICLLKYVFKLLKQNKVRLSSNTFD